MGMKILCIGDLHFGEKGNSEKFNQQVLEFLEWAVEYAKNNEVDHIVQFGDYFHTRHKIDVSSLNYGLRGAEILASFDDDAVSVLIGNHDLYYLERLDVSSVNTLRGIVHVVDSTQELSDNILITPWVCGGEQWDELVNKSDDYDYLFGHFELNGFKVNDGYEMEHGLSAAGLKRYKRVITGHYHTTQTKDNITYLGTPYPITMNEANEPHGVFVLDTSDDSLEFVQYDKIKVISMSLEDYLEYDGEFDPYNTSIRIEFPDDLEDESLIDEVRNKISEKGFSEVKIKYTSQKVNDILNSEVDVDEVENIDQAVVAAINASTEISGVNKDKLSKFYNLAIEKGTEA